LIKKFDEINASIYLAGRYAIYYPVFFNASLVSTLQCPGKTKVDNLEKMNQQKTFCKSSDLPQSSRKYILISDSRQYFRITSK
jgi:hypothetical protein